VTPKERVAAAVDRWGEDEVVSRCAATLQTDGSTVVTGDLLDLAMVLGSVTDRDWMAEGKPPGHAYWARVWAARALRYVWSERAAGAVVHTLADEQWRVREMAARVVADRQLGEAVPQLVERTTDEVPRVRGAAVRALAVVGEGEHIELVGELVDDPEEVVAAAAQAALDQLVRRLDRPQGVPRGSPARTAPHVTGVSRG